MSNQCSCRTVKNSQCSFKARASEEYCGRHKTCNRPIEHIQVYRQPRYGIVEKPTKFSPPFNTICEGSWDEKNAVLDMDFDIKWPSKYTFMLHVNAVEKALIYEKMKNPEKLGVYNNSAMYVAYNGAHAICPMCGTVLGSHMFKIKDFSRKILCWPESYASHYIANHNIMPTKRFFTFIEKMCEMLPINKEDGLGERAAHHA